MYSIFIFHTVQQFLLRFLSRCHTTFSNTEKFLHIKTSTHTKKGITNESCCTWSEGVGTVKCAERYEKKKEIFKSMFHFKSTFFFRSLLKRLWNEIIRKCNCIRDISLYYIYTGILIFHLHYIFLININIKSEI